MSIAAICHDVLTHHCPAGMPVDRQPQSWSLRIPVMRAFPRLAVERVEAPLVEARFDEEPERWDGMA